MQITAFAKGYKLFYHRTKVFRLGQGGGNLLVLDQRVGEVRKHRFAVAAFTV